MGGGNAPVSGHGTGGGMGGICDSGHGIAPTGAGGIKAPSKN
jgi:hypothetical protein